MPIKVSMKKNVKRLLVFGLFSVAVICFVFVEFNKTIIRQSYLFILDHFLNDRKIHDFDINYNMMHISHFTIHCLFIKAIFMSLPDSLIIPLHGSSNEKLRDLPGVQDHIVIYINPVFFPSSHDLHS